MFSPYGVATVNCLSIEIGSLRHTKVMERKKKIESIGTMLVEQEMEHAYNQKN